LEGCARRKEDIHPSRLGEDRWIERFEQNAGTTGQEIGVRVNIGPHICTQSPAGSEADGSFTRKEHTEESNKQNNEENDPIAPFAPLFILFALHFICAREPAFG
jgi:hypothetical protein